MHFHSTVLPGRQQIATSLPIHSLRPKSSSNQEDIPSFKTFLHSFIKFRNLDLDEGIFFRNAAFALSTIMIRTHLLIQWRIYGGSFTKFYVAFCFQEIKLPLDEGIVVRVKIGCDEGAGFINMDTVST